MEAALFEKQRPSAASVFDDSQKQRIIAKVCSDPPEDRVRWTVRLVAQEAVKRRLPRVGRETIRILLLDHDLEPWRKKAACSTAAWTPARHSIHDQRDGSERRADRG